MSLEFLASDFELMANFGLAWRWTDERWNLLPEDDLLAIRPFKKEAAGKLNEYSLELLEKVTKAEGPYALVLSVECGDDAAEVDVSETLQKHLVNCDQNVYVSWDPGYAVKCRLDVFCNYWDDFCYPSSDDVVVWPASETWVLMYRHYETFQLYQKWI